MSRPYFSLSLEELKALYGKHADDKSIVAAISHELSFRKTHAARAFLKQISTGTTTAKPSAPQKASSAKNHGTPSKITAQFRLTEEQQSAVDLFLSRGSLKVSAFAGAGKTSTLIAMARSDSRSGIYLAFNKSIAHEAKRRFPSTVDCRTTHSLALHSVKSAFPSNSSKLVGPLNGNAVATILGLEPLAINGTQLSRRSYGSLIHRCVLKFCQSADVQFKVNHIPVTGKLAVLKEPEREILRNAVLDGAKHLWNRMLNPSDATPLGHDGYLKLWALSGPVITRDFILLDEAQDTNAVVLDVLGWQESQLIYVGDTHQQIYEWRGAINAMDRMATDHHSYLTMSFRFGEPIAAAANKILQALGEEKSLKGNPAQSSQIGTSSFDAMLSRTNATLVSELMNVLAKGRRVHIIGGAADILRLLEGIRDLQASRPSDVPELFGYLNWEEVVAAVATDEGHELRTLVNLVQRFGVEQLISAVKRTHDTEQSADIVLSTVHKAKGREWNRVRLTDDFLIAKTKSDDGKKSAVAPEELRIAYVAMTRAKQAIYVPAGIRSAFSIVQGPALDTWDTQNASGSDSWLGNKKTSEQPTKPPPGPTKSNNAPGSGWLDRIRDWFR